MDTLPDKTCWGCNWCVLGFCSSTLVLLHLRQQGEVVTYVVRKRDDLPLYADCWLRADRPVTEHPGQRPQHSVVSASPDLTKPDAVGRVARSVGMDVVSPASAEAVDIDRGKTETRREGAGRL